MSAPVIPLFPNGPPGPLPSGEKAPCRKDIATLYIIIGGGVNGRGGEGPLGAEDVLEVWQGHTCLRRPTRAEVRRLALESLARHRVPMS